MIKEIVYYLPGRGGKLDSGLGLGIKDLGFTLQGRETWADFRGLSFQEQIDLIRADLESNFWRDDASVIANSYGAYLFLHVQAEMEPFPGRVLLLSPIIGPFENTATGQQFLPPRASTLNRLLAARRLPRPMYCEIHVGSEDWQSCAEEVGLFSADWDIVFNVLSGAGHMLPRDYVSEVLRRFLAK